MWRRTACDFSSLPRLVVALVSFVSFSSFSYLIGRFLAVITALPHVLVRKKKKDGSRIYGALLAARVLFRVYISVYDLEMRRVPNKLAKQMFPTIVPLFAHALQAEPSDETHEIVRLCVKIFYAFTYCVVPTYFSEVCSCAVFARPFVLF